MQDTLLSAHWVYDQHPIGGFLVGGGGVEKIWNMTEVFNPTHILYLNSNHHNQPEPTLDF